MAGKNLELGEDLIGVLATLERPVEQSARELIVLDLYRERKISSGRSASCLGFPFSNSSSYPQNSAFPFSI